LALHSNLLYERTVENESSEGDVNGGGFILLYPKKTTLAKRLHTDDEDFLDFVSQLLQMDPSRRPTAEEALGHPWIVSGVRREEEEQQPPGDDHH